MCESNCFFYGVFMLNIIFTSRYLRDAPPEQMRNDVRPIGTRKGVGKIDEGKRVCPRSCIGKNLSNKWIRDISQAKDLLEYADL